jgi:hypothetical protein
MPKRPARDTVADLRQCMVPLLMLLPKEERRSEVNKLMRMAGLNIHDWMIIW